MDDTGDEVAALNELIAEQRRALRQCHPRASAESPSPRRPSLTLAPRSGTVSHSPSHHAVIPGAVTNALAVAMDELFTVFEESATAKVDAVCTFSAFVVRAASIHAALLSQEVSTRCEIEHSESLGFAKLIDFHEYECRDIAMRIELRNARKALEQAAQRLQAQHSAELEAADALHSDHRTLIARLRET